MSAPSEGEAFATAFIHEWCHLYGWRDNPAWVMHDLLTQDLTVVDNPPTMEGR